MEDSIINENLGVLIPSSATFETKVNELRPEVVDKDLGVIGDGEYDEVD